MKRAYNRMKRAHKQMKRTHKDDYGTSWFAHKAVAASHTFPFVILMSQNYI